MVHTGSSVLHPGHNDAVHPSAVKVIAGVITVISMFVLVDSSGPIDFGSASPSLAAGPKAGAAEEGAPIPAIVESTAVAAAPLPAPSTSLSAVVDRPTMVQQVEAGVASAAAVDVEQAVAVIDRTTGELIASHSGDRRFNAESITKLFTVAYYLIQEDGAPDADLADDLRRLVQDSNNEIQYDLWQPDIIPTIAERYQLTNTSNSRAESSNTWGSDRITANDEVAFLYKASLDPLVGPTPDGLDGRNGADRR